MAIAQTPQAIINQSLLASASYTPTFQNLLQQQSTQTQQTIAGCDNSAPTPGGTITYGKVLAGPTFLPAPVGTKFSIGRSGTPITYLCLSRIGAPSSSIASSSFLQGIQGYLNTPQTPIVPHLVISYQGNVVQLVDMDNTANYLQLPPQSPPSPIDASPTGLIDALITLTAGFESAGNAFTAFNPNDNGHGASYGFIQFNQQKGGLYNLMVLMNQVDKNQFSTIFGSLVPTLLNATLLQNIQLTNLTPYREQFIAAGQYPPFQQAQVTLARQGYFDTVVNPAGAFNLTSQRALAMLFDTNVQGGLGKVTTFLQQAKNLTNQANVTPTSTNYQKYFLAQFAQLADTLPFSNNRRTRLYNTQALSDGPLYFNLPQNTSTEQVQDASCIYIALEGRYGDPTTSQMLTALAQTLNACSTGCNIGAGTNIIPWTAFDHSSVAAPFNLPIDNTMGNFPFPTLYSQLLNPINVSSSIDSVFVPSDQPVLATAISSALSTLVSSISNASTQGQKLFVLQAYDQTKALSRATSLGNSNRGNFYAANSTSLGNSSSVLNSTGTSSIASSNSSTATPDTSQYQANVTGLLYNFSTGLWNDGKAAGKIATASTSSSNSSTAV